MSAQPVKSQGLCFLSTSYLEITSSLFMATSLWFIQGPGKTLEAGEQTAESIKLTAFLSSPGVWNSLSPGSKITSSALENLQALFGTCFKVSSFWFKVMLCMWILFWHQPDSETTLFQMKLHEKALAEYLGNRGCLTKTVPVQPLVLAFGTGDTLWELQPDYYRTKLSP